jgi:hypothetical protein
MAVGFIAKFLSSMSPKTRNSYEYKPPTNQNVQILSASTFILRTFPEL